MGLASEMGPGARLVWDPACFLGTELDHEMTRVCVLMYHHMRYLETQTQLASNPVTKTIVHF
jgi:hypothetical protein